MGRWGVSGRSWAEGWYTNILKIPCIKFSKINTNVVLKKNPVSLGKLLYFSYLFSIYGKATIIELIAVIIVTHTYSHITTIVYLWGGELWGSQVLLVLWCTQKA